MRKSQIDNLIQKLQSLKKEDVFSGYDDNDSEVYHKYLEDIFKTYERATDYLSFKEMLEQHGK